MEIDKIRKLFNRDRLGIIGEEEEYSRYSVMIPLVKINGEFNILFEVRAKHLRNQPGEISFPGGRIEEGELTKDAAIRETCEELGINSTDLEVLGQTDIMITHHNKIIYPYIGFIRDFECVKPSSEEVDHEFYVPLSFLMETSPVIKKIKLLTEIEEEFPYQEQNGSVNYRMAHGKSNIYFYKYGEYIIWGLTAKILSHFIKRIKNK